MAGESGIRMFGKGLIGFILDYLAPTGFCSYLPRYRHPLLNIQNWMLKVDIYLFMNYVHR